MYKCVFVHQTGLICRRDTVDTMDDVEDVMDGAPSAGLAN